jgi:hypothetical protein
MLVSLAQCGWFRVPSQPRSHCQLRTGLPEARRAPSSSRALSPKYAKNLDRAAVPGPANTSPGRAQQRRRQRLVAEHAHKPAVEGSKEVHAIGHSWIGGCREQPQPYVPSTGGEVMSACGAGLRVVARPDGWCPTQRWVAHHPRGGGRPTHAKPEHRCHRRPTRHTDCPTDVDAPVANSSRPTTAQCQLPWLRPAARTVRRAADQNGRTPRLGIAAVC